MSHLRLLLTTLLVGVALAILTAWASVAHAKTFNVPCDVAALNDAMAAASFNDEEDVLWLAPSCVYPLTGILIAYPDGGFPLTINGSGATLSGKNERTAILVNQGATLYLENVTVTEGSAGVPATGDGGAIYNAGTLTLTHSTVSQSRAVTGGGILNEENASLTLIESTVSGNTASQDGGGILNRKGRLTLIGSTVSGNSALGSSGVGAGIYNRSSFSGARAIANLTNSTISGNSSRFGAGIYNGEGVVTVSHCTISDNTMLGGGNGGGLYNQNYSGLGSLKLGNSIVANSIAEVGGGYDCVRDPFLPENPITPFGGNLIGDGSCEVVGAFAADPKLGPLTGSPAYHPLLPDSPAIDLAQNPNCPGFDQRGAPRPKDGNGDSLVICDLGAFEAP
jgi:hypothetical protein